MKLNNRLSKIATFVTSGAILVDIGCDHGYLSIELVQSNKIKYAYASDINPGPLNNVQTNVLKYGLSEYISCVLSDGLERFDNISFSDLVIAGMGGTLISEILESKKELLVNKNLILQPNTNGYGLRKWLINNNFIIEKEELVEDNDIIYEVIVARTGKGKKYSELELLFGSVNLDNKKPILFKYMDEYLKKQTYIIKNIPSDNVNYQVFSKRINLVKEFLNENR